MTFSGVCLHILSALALAGVACRLHSLPCASGCWRSTLAWNLWVAAHVLLGLGLLARLFHMEPQAAWFVTAGLAMYFGARWQRRSGDR